jgi:hypothetical protein
MGCCFVRALRPQTTLPHSLTWQIACIKSIKGDESTLSHSLSLSLSFSHSLTLSLSHSLTLSLRERPLTCPNSDCDLTYTLTYSLTLSLSHSHSHAHSLSPSLSHFLPSFSFMIAVWANLRSRFFSFSIMALAFTSDSNDSLALSRCCQWFPPSPILSLPLPHALSLSYHSTLSPSLSPSLSLPPSLSLSLSLSQVFAVPSYCLSAITLEAYKKYVLISLILKGELASLPKYASHVSRDVKHLCHPYAALETAVKSLPPPLIISQT